MAKFEEFKPKLVPCVIHVEGERVVLEERGTGRHYVLPGDTRALVERFDGTRTVREIITSLHLEKVPIRFRTLLNTIDQLERAKFIEFAGADAPRAQVGPVSQGWRERLNGFRDLGFKKVLFPKVASGFKATPLFYVLALLTIGVSIACVARGRYHDVGNTFLFFHDSYVKGLAFFLVAGFGLFSIKCVLQCVLLTLASGKFYGFSFRFSRFSFHFSVDDSSIYLMSGRVGPVLFYLASLGSLFVFTSTVAWFFHGSYWLQNLKTLTVVFTLLELNPYRPTELQRLFYLFQRDGVTAHLLPYLKSRSLFSILAPQEKIAEESALVMYAAYALTWTSGALFFFTGLAAANCGNLLLAVKDGSMAERGSAALVMAGIAMTWSYFWLDLIATFAKNLAYPLRKRIAGYRRNSRPRKAALSSLVHVKAVLRKNPLFEGLDEAVFEELLNHADRRTFSAGTPLIVQGLDNRELFAVVDGSVRVLRHEPSGAVSEVSVLGPSSVVGETSVLENKNATSDVIAREATECVVIDRDVVQKFGSAALLEKISLGHLIGASPIFRKLPKEVLHLITNRGILARMGAGKVVFEEGAPGNTLYLLVRGRVEVMQGKRKVKELSQGDFFGEIALIAQVPRSATIKTLEDCLFLQLDSGAFWEILVENVQFSLFLESVADLRVRENAFLAQAA